MSDTRSAWDKFWAYDRLSSFGTGPGSANYAGPIAEGWRAFFASLPDRARILDLATGNGAVAVMAVEAGKSFDVTGADLADIRPAAFVSTGQPALEQIHFLAKTPAEELPLPDAGFDAIVSQYGIEYSDLAHSLPEALRVLASGGRLRFGLHAAEGSVAATTRKAIADADFLLDDIDLTGRASRCFEAVVTAERSRQRTPEQVAAASQAYDAFRDGVKAASEHMARATDHAMLDNVRQQLIDTFQKRQFADIADLVAKTAKLRDEIIAHRERQRALLTSALSAEQIADLAEQLRALGMADVTHGEQRDGAALIGHVIEAKRP